MVPVGPIDGGNFPRQWVAIGIAQLCAQKGHAVNDRSRSDDQL